MAGKTWAERFTNLVHPDRKPARRRVRDNEHVSAMTREQLEAAISGLRVTR